MIALAAATASGFLSNAFAPKGASRANLVMQDAMSELLAGRTQAFEMSSASEQALRRYAFRLEYTVNTLADKLGVMPPTRLESFDDEAWLSVLEEIHPYLERQWTGAAKAKALEVEAAPLDALNLPDRLALRARYVQRLEREIGDVVSAVGAIPATGYANRAQDDNYVEALEEAVAVLNGRFDAFSSSAW